MRTRIPLFTLMRIRVPTYHFDADPIQLITLMQIRILFLYKVMRFCDHFFTKTPRGSILSLPRLHCERPRAIKAPITLVFPFCCELQPILRLARNKYSTYRTFRSSSSYSVFFFLSAEVLERDGGGGELLPLLLLLHTG